MKKLYELFGINPTKGDVGIEIECEGNNLKPVMDGGWRTEDDNSLRGEYPHSRCEWVFAKPLTLTDAYAALQYMEDAQKKAGAKFNFSFRTSVHVHVNVQRLTKDEIINLMYTYFLCERVMMNYCAPHRSGNRFCLRMEDAEGLMTTVTKLIRAEEGQWVGLNPHDRIRYSALNLEALWKYGSLEFRGLEGNMNIDRIHAWASAYVNMREFAKKFKNLQEIHDLYVKSKPSQFFEMAVGDVAPRFTYQGYVNDLRRGFSLTIDMPYAYKAKPEVEVPEEAPGIIHVRPVNPAPMRWADLEHRVFPAGPAHRVVVDPAPAGLVRPAPARPARPQF